MSAPIKNRYDFVILFDVENGNPNGDPDAGNMPRIDPETGYGLVTDVCLKRKIRNYVETLKEDAPGYRIYIKDGTPLNRSDNEALAALGIKEDLKAAKKADPGIDRKLQNYMCENYFDIRTFGAVMTTFVKGALNCGQVRGPVQLTFARSIDPVVPQEVTITRVAITTEADAEKKGTEMGRKHIVPYALYRAEGYVSANLARKTTGFSEDDLKKAKKSDPEIDRKLRDYMCEHFYDIRTFGAVMTTFVKGALNCGQVRGPVQLSFARSIDPIVPQEVTITRVAITTEADAEKKNSEMGNKHIVPYGLYRAEGYVSANLARKTTGFSEEDLQLLWQAILNMFENDHSAARGKMAVRELIVFKHDSELGNAPAYKLFDAVTVAHKAEVIAPRSYQDYTVTVADTLPEGVHCERFH